jgi:predicted ATPase
MLTRLKVHGFKNLMDADIWFGPFTCVAGINATGKSNLFDAIEFLSKLSDQTLVQAASGIRSEGRGPVDPRSLFHRVGDRFSTEMSFEAEMVIPREGIDDLGQKAQAAVTFLRYTLRLGYRDEEGRESLGPLELLSEELRYISKVKHPLHFPHTKEWLNSVVKGTRGSAFISTEGDEANRIIQFHQDRSSGRPRPLKAKDSPRTALSSANTAEFPTALLVRREMQSWRRLQLEPTALRRPDDFNDPSRLSPDGSHLPATLHRLATRQNGGAPGRAPSDAVYARIANRVGELIEDIVEVSVDSDLKRETHTLLARGRDGTPHTARSLSDGTLRFLALSVLEQDPEFSGLVCLEEPENGIHPARVPAMIRLIQDIAVDPSEAVGPDNPLRQMIVNTHSPSVVLQIPDGSLVIADLQAGQDQRGRFTRAQFSCLAGTWRTRTDPPAPVVSKGKLLAYLNPVDPVAESNRVVDRPEVRQLMFDFSPSSG